MPVLGSVQAQPLCWRTTSPLLEAEGVYLTTNTEPNHGPARVRSGDVDTGVDFAQCFWNGAGVEVWQESNGQPGLQAHADGGCIPDTIVLGAQGAVTRQCIV